MKQRMVFCGNCKTYTSHSIYSDQKKAERIFFGLITIGLNELMVEKYYECMECGTIRIYD
jgi:uncharacterized CHY-type Zn-finger protein